MAVVFHKTNCSSRDRMRWEFGDKPKTHHNDSEMKASETLLWDGCDDSDL
jgi:hypothetical protein